MNAARVPAIEGGTPVRARPLPYGRHEISDDDLAAVSRVLRNGWLTTGPVLQEFERGVASAIGASDAIAMSSGTAALHAACATLDLARGDEVIVPSLTFVASANAVLYCGGRPVFAEISPDTFLLDPVDVERKVTSRTRAVMPVHYAGLAAHIAQYRAAAGPGRVVLEDAAHALGATDGGTPVGARSDLATFSFHPVKHVTTAEGGAVATTSEERAARLRRFRNHGMTTDAFDRERAGGWKTVMTELGMNYRLNEIGAALGLSQLRRLDENLSRRRLLARRYLSEMRDSEMVRPQRVADVDAHAWHIFPVLLQLEGLRVDRDTFLRALRAEGINATVLYEPVHLQPYYQRTLGTRAGLLPTTEDICRRLIVLPLFPAMTDLDQRDVLEALNALLAWYRR